MPPYSPYCPERGKIVAMMFPYTNQIVQVGAPPYLSHLPLSPPFPGMIANPWNPMFHIHLSLILTQKLNSKPIPTTPQVHIFQYVQLIPKPTQVTPQVSQPI